MNLEQLGAGLDRHAPLGVKGSLGPQAPEPELRDWEEVAGTIDPAAYLESLDRELDRLERLGDDKIVARRFFSELDREANPILLQGMVSLGRIHREDADQRRITIKVVSNELRERLRLREEATGSDVGIAQRPVAHLMGRCRSVSQLVLGLIDRYFGEDLGAFEQAVKQFESFELRVPLPGGLATVQPSSANFLLFKEFSALACDINANTKRWNGLVATFAKASLSPATRP